MANLFLPLPAPAANGPGTPVDVSTFGLLKTVTYRAASGFLFNPTVIIEFSNEFVPVNFAPLAVMGEPNEISIPVAAHWMRVTVANYRGGGAPVVNVGANDHGASFATLIAPPGSGTGVGVDVSALGATKTIHVATAFRGVLNIEISEDGGATYNQIASFFGPGHRTLMFAADFMRATRAGVPQVSPGVPIINIGAVSDGNAGIIVEDEGVALGLFGTINFVGAGVTATDVAGIATVNIPGVAAGVVGTPGTYAMFTGVNAVGDSTFPIKQTSATALTIGDDTINDVITINAKLTVNATPGANGDVLQVIAGVPQWGPLSSAGGVTGTGTAGTYAMFTGASTIGNSTFPITEASATALTIGDDTINDLTTLNGRFIANSTSGAAHGFILNYTPVAVAVNDNSAIYVAVGGTADATAGNVAVNGFNVDATTTRSAGANNVITQGLRVFASGGQDVRAGRFSATGGTVASYGVLASATATATDNYGVSASATGAGTTNYGGNFTATGAGTNIALRTISGDVLLNNTAGVATIGFSNATVQALTIKGSMVQTVTAVQIADSITWTPVAATISGLAAVKTSSNGTFDTTAGALNSNGVYAQVTSTRSAGANNLSNFALRGDASGAQVNQALRTDNGDVVLNATSGTTTIGFSNATAAALTVKGQTVSTYTGSTLNANTLTWTPVAGTTTSISSVSINANGTIDTTASGLQTRGLSITNTMSRSAGANNLTNYGLIVTATGGQVNNALQTNDGAVILNQASGTTTVGFGSSTAAAFNVSGASVFNSTNTTSNALLSTANPAGSTTSLSALRGTNSGTWDTTAGALEVYAIRGLNTASRSAGANNLTTVGILGDGSGGQINMGVSGRTSGTAATNYGGNFQATGAGTTNIAIYGTATGAGTNQALKTDSGDVLLNNTAGVATIGFSNATAAALTVKGQTVSTYTGLTLNANTLTWTPVAGTTSALAALSVTGNGTFDTTAGALTNRGVSSSVTSTRSAGANNLTNKAGIFTASGAQVNIALETTAGDNYLNATSGNTAIGVASGTALTNKLTVAGASLTAGASTTTWTPVSSTTASLSAVTITGNGTFDTTGGSMGERALLVQATSTRSAGGGALTNIAIDATATGAQSNIALRTVSGDVQLNATAGTTTIGFSNATAAALTVKGQTVSTYTGLTLDANTLTWTPVASTTSALAALSVTGNGTFDATAGALTNRGVSSSVTSTRSAGANNVTNKAGIFTASGAQVNIAVETTDGSNYLNTTSGSTGVGYASGAALPAKFSVTGAITLTTTLTIGGALAHQGTTVGFYNTAPVVQQTVTGSRVSGAALTDLLTKLATTGIIIDGTIA